MKVGRLRRLARPPATGRFRPTLARRTPMPISVQFDTNRVLTGPAEDWRSYGDNALPLGVPDDIIYATAFVDEVNLTADTVGAITSIENVSKGGFSQEAIGDLSQAGRNLLIFVHGFDNSFE